MKVNVPEWRRIRGFVRLIQRQTASQHSRDWLHLEEALESARRHAEHAATARIAANKAESDGFNGSAKQYEARAHLDHVAMCSRLANAGKIVQRMFEYASLDWRPSKDVAGSGLADDELDLICELMGASRAPKEAVEDDGKREG